jgi:hypothetical protein
MPSLIIHVSLFDESGTVHSFGPGDSVPEWARKRITNPQVWDETPVVEESSDGPPPQGGPGGSRQAWADYAASKKVAVQDDWKRDDIIEACEKAGVEV